MARKIKSLDEMPVDMVQAVKRGFLHHGLIHRKHKRNKHLVQPDTQEPGQDESQRMSKDVSRRKDELPPEEVHEKLIDITQKAQDVLFKADTVFPFTLFPSTVTLDREKLTIAHRIFFRVAKIITVPVTSMVSAEADVGPFFGSIHMTSKYFIDNTHHLNYLWRKDATELQCMLQGYVIAQERKIDVSEIDKDDLRVLLHDLGQGVSG
jgi:hypothetical protein